MTTFLNDNSIGIKFLFGSSDFCSLSLLQVGSSWRGYSVGVAIVVIVLLFLALIWFLRNRLKDRDWDFGQIQQTLNFAANSSRVSIWYFDIAKNRLTLAWGESFLFERQMDFEAFVALLLPEYRDHFRKLFSDVSRGKQGKTSVSFRMMDHKTDYYVECCMCGLAHRGANVERVVVTIKEITERIESQKQQELEQLKIDLVIRSCGIILWDYDVLQRRIFSYREGVFHKEQPIDIDSYVESVHPDDRAIILGYIKQMDDGVLGRFEVEARSIVGEYEDFQWIIIEGVPYKRDDSGRVIKYTGLWRNNTAWKKICKDVEVLKDKTVMASRFELAFLSDINYRLRTPLNAVIGFSSLLEKTENEHDRQVFLEIIRLNNELLLGVLSDIVSYSKTEGDTIRYNKSLVSATRICREAYNNNCLCIPVGMEFVMNVPNSDIFVEVDHKKIINVINNLLDNAVQFTTKGKIEIGFEQKGDLVEFFVQDTGIGIPKENQAFVFDKLIKLNEATAGMGLGLAVCKNIIEHLGGTIGVDSEENVGSRFWFRFPLKEDTNNDTDNECEANNNAVLNSNNMDQKEMNTNESLGGEKPFILIAEDNESNYFLAYTILKKEYTIEHATNGVEAVEMVASKNPDLVLMDMKMPIMGGLEATRKIREAGATLPIIALTAHAFDSDMDQALEAGCDDFVTKPIDTAKLKEVIQKHLNK